MSVYYFYFVQCVVATVTRLLHFQRVHVQRIVANKYTVATYYGYPLLQRGYLYYPGIVIVLYGKNVYVVSSMLNFVQKYLYHNERP